MACNVGVGLAVVVIDDRIRVHRVSNSEVLGIPVHVAALWGRCIRCVTVGLSTRVKRYTKRLGPTIFGASSHHRLSSLVVVMGFGWVVWCTTVRPVIITVLLVLLHPHRQNVLFVDGGGCRVSCYALDVLVVYRGKRCTDLAVANGCFITDNHSDGSPKKGGNFNFQSRQTHLHLAIPYPCCPNRI